MKVAAYCRVSTDKLDQTNSFESQKKYFTQYIHSNPDWELYRIYADEGITGTSTKKRREFKCMMEDALSGNFKLIITKEVSRFSRNILDTLSCTRKLKSAGVGVLFLTDGINTMDADAELRLSIMASLAQEESRRTSDRVTWGQTRQMEKGVVFGHSLLGYEVKNGELFIETEGAETVRRVFSEYADMKKSTAEIAAALEKDGVRTYSGNNRWSAASVLKILRNEKYVGDLVQKKSYTPDYLTHEKKQNNGQVPLITIKNHHEPVIGRELWDRAQKRLRKNNRRKPGVDAHSDKFIFSGRIFCGECGSVFVSRSKKIGEMNIRRWCCRGAAAGQCAVGLILRDDDALDMVKLALAGFEDEYTGTIRELASEVIKTQDVGGISREKAEKVREGIEEKKCAMLDSYIAGEIDREEMQKLKEYYNQKIREISGAAKSLENLSEEEVFNQLKAIFTGENENKTFYKSIIHSIRVYKNRFLELRLNGSERLFIFKSE